MAFTILTKKAFLFINHAERKKSKDEASASNFVRVMPGNPVEVPDWVREDLIYKLGTADMDIMEVVTAPMVANSTKVTAEDVAALGIQVPKTAEEVSETLHVPHKAKKVNP